MSAEGGGPASPSEFHPNGDSQAADVLIVGAGPAGAATALALINAGVSRVLFVHRPTHSPFQIGQSAAPGLDPLLRRLGLTDDLGRLGHAPYYGNVSVWGSPTPSIDDFLRHGTGQGWHLDRTAFDGWLRSQAIRRGARLISPAAVDAISYSSGRWRVRLRCSGQLREELACVVVDATGRFAAVATRLGARRVRLDTLIALCVLVSAESSLGGLLLIEAVEIGWWYAASLPNGLVVVAFLTDHDLARAAGLRNAEKFLAAWNTTEQLATRVPPPASDDLSVAVFPAATQYIDRAVGPGWLAVGDALVAFDPLTSAGITGALEDGLAAAATIVRWLGTAESPARTEDSAAYARRADQMFRRYLAQRQAIYAIERRWVECAFWRRRVNPTYLNRGGAAGLTGSGDPRR